MVEDDGEIRRLNIKVLTRAGYQVDAAEDGASAWDALQLHRYDLLVTDNEMPKMSGIELIRKLRAARMQLPVVMAAATVPTPEFISAPELQPIATLFKPFTLDELLETVRGVLRTAGDASRQPEEPSAQLMF